MYGWLYWTSSGEEKSVFLITLGCFSANGIVSEDICSELGADTMMFAGDLIDIVCSGPFELLANLS